MIEINAGDILIHVFVNAVKATFPVTNQHFFGSLTGEITIPAVNFNTNRPGKNAAWVMLPDLWQAAGNMGISPVTAHSITTPQIAPYLEYKVLPTAKESAVIFLSILPTQYVLP